MQTGGRRHRLRPDVDLRIDDLHGLRSSFCLLFLAEIGSLEAVYARKIARVRTSGMIPPRPQRRGVPLQELDQIGLTAGAGFRKDFLQVSFYGGDADPENIGGLLRRLAFGDVL